MRVTEKLFAYALECDDIDGAAEFGFELSRRLYQQLRDDDSVETIARVIERVKERAQPRILFNLYATYAWYLSTFRRVEEAQRALDSATELIEHGDDEARVRYHEACAHILVHSGKTQEYRGHLESALAIASALGPRILLRRLDNAIGLAAASNVEDMDYVLELCRRMEETALQAGDSSSAQSRAMSAWPLYLSGQLSRAHAALQCAFPYAEDAPLLAFFLARTGIPVALHLEDAMLLRRCARPRLLENAFASGTPNVFGPVAAAIAMQLRHENRSGEAIALIEHAVKRLPNAANNIPLLLEVARANATTAMPRSIAMLDELAPQSRSARAAWHLVKAYSSRGNDRRDYARMAASQFASIQWVLVQAEAHELAGDVDSALEIYRGAGSLAGIRRLEARNAAQADSVLSKREWEVARLVAEGKSNRTIAEDLVLSERTIENHIASIFTKLNLRSRAEVAVFVARNASPPS